MSEKSHWSTSGSYQKQSESVALHGKDSNSTTIYPCRNGEGITRQSEWQIQNTKMDLLWPWLFVTFVDSYLPPGRLSWFKGLPWQPGAGQATTFGLWCGKIGPRFSAQTQGGLCWTEAGIMRSACLYGSSLERRLCPCWAKSGQCWAILGPSWTYVGPSRAHVEHCWAHLGPILGQVGPMLGPSWAHVQPMLGPCWSMLGLCWPILTPLGSYVGAMGHVWASYVETILRCNFFRPGPLLEPKTT